MILKAIDRFTDFICHEGRGHDDAPPGPGSGRLPWGSGDNPYQHLVDLRHRKLYLEKKHPDWSKTKIAATLGFFNSYGFNQGKPSVELMERSMKLAKDSDRLARAYKCKELYDQGLSKEEIGRRLDMPGTTVGKYIREENDFVQGKSIYVTEALRKFVNEHKYVDVGAGTELYMSDIPNVSRGEFKAAVQALVDEGYGIHTVKHKQAGTSNMTTYTVLTPPGVSHTEAQEHKFDIAFMSTADKVIDPEGNITAFGLNGKVQSIDHSRIQVSYSSPSDGLIELRRGVPDLSLGLKAYAQVRIGVDDTHYLKGMAVYKDDMPPGIDVIFHTGKKEGTPLFKDPDDPNASSVFKEMKMLKDSKGNVIGVDWDNPFGASIDPKSEIMQTTSEYYDKDGIVRKSAINVLHEEAAWEQYRRTISPQYWSKQSEETAKRQLRLAADMRLLEFDSIKRCENPTVRKRLLEAFADECDAAAVSLKAAPFKGQATCVLLPAPDLPDNEVYAPRYPDGTQIVLVRYPHAGAFESPMLTVRNTGSPAQKMIPLDSGYDCVCINKKRLDQLSGADCDGDFVITIPVQGNPPLRYSQETLPGLVGYDHKLQYRAYPGMKVISHRTMQTKMGETTNLITDMSFQKPDIDDLTCVVKHSMTIIDSEKSELDWKRSERENRISEIKDRYQRDEQGHTGAGTILSRAKSPKDVPERMQWKPMQAHYKKDGTYVPATIDDEGNKVYTPTGRIVKSAKLNLDNVTLADGKKVKLAYDNNAKMLYYATKDPNNARKKVRNYVDEGELPERLRGLNFTSDGRVYLNDDDGRKSDKPYYVRFDESTRKNVRVYINDDDIIDVKERTKMQKSTKMAEAKDAFEITSGGSKEWYGHGMEKVAADYANEMKQLARDARKEWMKTGDQEKNPEAAKKYAKEVASLDQKLKEAKANSPLEREANMKMRRVMQIKKYENPNMTKDEQKKKEGQAIDAARRSLGAGKKKIIITPEEYEAIKAGAITKTKLQEIMKDVDLTSLRAQATPKTSRRPLSTASKASIARLVESGVLTRAQIAERFNISLSYVQEIAGGE